MSTDLVVLTPAEPDDAALVKALMAAGPQLRVGSIGHGVALQLFAEDGALVTTVEAPTLIQVPGEAVRLLDVEAAFEPTVPYWWVELRTPSLNPDAIVAAERLAAALAVTLGGAVWRPRTVPRSAEGQAE